MKIKEGEKLPDAKVFVIDMKKEYEHKEISTSEILNKDKIILFGLPGAFTPGCSKKHLPSFIESAEKLREKNIEPIVPKEQAGELIDNIIYTVECLD